MKSKISKFGAIVFTVIMIGTAFFVPVGSVEIEKEKNINNNFFDDSDLEAYRFDRRYIIEPIIEPVNVDDYDDAGYKKDTGDEISRSFAIFPGEMIDNTPGRGNTGKISSSDKEDWYFFAICFGQQFKITLNPPSGFNLDLGLWDKEETELATSTNAGSATESITYTAPYTGNLYIRILYISGADESQYSFAVTTITQNDANIGQDAGDDFSTANLITQGYYHGYLDMNDGYDWYKFNVNSGQGIHFILQTKIAIYSDFDIELYNPSGTMMYRGAYYGEDEILYPADTSGEWRVKIYLFPGWIDIPHPTNWKYYAYSSGPYNLTFSLESSAPDPMDPIQQPEITPIAQTFKITNDPTSSKDDYGYFASIPACNYIAGGQRYVSPIIYTGDTTPTAYYDDPTAYGTVDDTTQYLIDDWNAYLALFGRSASQYAVPADPIKAAAEIATKNWQSSSTAVVAIDGSSYQDTTKVVLTRSATLKRDTEVSKFNGNDPKINKDYGYPMALGQKWGAVSISVKNLPATDTTADFVNIWPKFMSLQDDWWPDIAGEPRTDIYYPITSRLGIWAGSASKYSASEELEITKYACQRYNINLGDADQTLKVTVKTTELSDLLVLLVDPSGNIRAPIIEAWNGAVVNPIHWWNGFENETGFEEWKSWNPEPHTEFSAEVLHPESGKWQAIVVPRNTVGSSSIKYTITGTVTTLNSKGTDAAMSAANAAVIASQKHLPLLYVNEDSVPAETASAFTTLGVTKVIFVERNNIGSGVRSKLPSIEPDLTSMEKIVAYIKGDPSSENYITITSLRTGVGYAATGAMLAAYHGSPVLRIEEADGDPASISDRIEAFFRWDGDYYHGERSNGHLPRATAPVDQVSPLQMLLYFITGGKMGSLPVWGMDMDRYWYEAVYNGVHDMITKYNLDTAGKEGYCFVAPRNDISLPVYAALMGNNSYTGGIPGITPAYSSDLIVRNILYPALIYANSNRDVTTLQLMNFPDGTQWTTNDKKITSVYSSRVLKDSFSSHGRIFDPHCLWQAHLERMNEGASVLYYSGHGTGGSGISAMYEQTEHSKYPNQIWWDAWRGYMYDNWKTARNGGFTWYNPSPPNLYDIVHYKYVDQLLENLHSNAIFYMSCTTGDADGPMVYLDHGAVCWYGNAGTGLCPEADLADDIFFDYTLKEGEMIGPAFSTQVWLHFRDYTTSDPTAMYGVSSLYGGAAGGGVTTRQVIYGDPNLIIYSPEWTAPVPIDSNI